MLLALPTTAWADWVWGQGDYQFTTEIAEVRACAIAQERAKENALISRGGEVVGAQDILLCSEKADQSTCELNRTVWRHTGGEIKGLRNAKSSVTQDGPIKTCTVTLEAEIQQRDTTASELDVEVDINRNLFRDGDELFIHLFTRQPAYVTVFQWVPSDQVMQTAYRLFPNSYDNDNRINGKRAIPPKGDQSPYRFRVRSEGSKDEVHQEFLMIVASASPIAFSESYDLKSLNAKLAAIPANKKAILRRSYGVLAQ